MADAVTTATLFNGSHRLIMSFTNLSDGTGESGVTKVNLASYTGVTGLFIDKIIYDVGGMTLQIQANGTSPRTLFVLAGYGTMCFEPYSGLSAVNTGSGGGNIIFTTVGQTVGDSYTITLELRKIGT